MADRAYDLGVSVVPLGRSRTGSLRELVVVVMQGRGPGPSKAEIAGVWPSRGKIPGGQVASTPVETCGPANSHFAFTQDTV